MTIPIFISVYHILYMSITRFQLLYRAKFRSHQNERLTITNWILYMARVAIRRELPQIKDEDQLEMKI